VGDVWRYRFPDDTIFRHTYPVGEKSPISIKYFTQELTDLSHSIENQMGLSFSDEKYRQAVALVGEFRELAQYLYATRIVRPDLISYSELTALVQYFLVTSSLDAIDSLREKKRAVETQLESSKLVEIVESIVTGLLNQQLEAVDLPSELPTPRIAVLGGMVEPQAIASLFEVIPKVTDEVVVIDVLSFGFKTVFTPPLGLKGDPYEETAKTLLDAPLEPTQEGLRRRQEFLRKLLDKLQIQGAIICEQSFCDPDEFEAPALQAAVSDAGVASLRLPLDPELSDRSRLEVRIQTFLETLENG
jgi:benzoyl-CoA reductase/2-hydroxyglutaryl-CoA dehydratase subunit BcrC/BadD/HgdB